MRTSAKWWAQRIRALLDAHGPQSDDPTGIVITVTDGAGGVVDIESVAGDDGASYRVWVADGGVDLDRLHARIGAASKGERRAPNVARSHAVAAREELTREAARDALRTLRGMFDGFGFGGDVPGPNRDTAVAALLSVVARQDGLAGPVPLFVVEGNAGTGKTLLVDAIATVATDRDALRFPDDEAETKRQIDYAAKSRPGVMLYDGVWGTFGNPTLDRALTATEWQTRTLGTSGVVTVPLSTVWFAAGIRVALRPDTARRAARIRLGTGRARNAAFLQHEPGHDLLAYLRRNRARLHTAATIVLRGYDAAGRPPLAANVLPPWGAFEAWRDVVLGALCWAGGNPCDSAAAPTRRKKARK